MSERVTRHLDLYRISRITRYDAEQDAWLPARYLTVQALVDDLLTPIENNLSQILGKAARCPPLVVDP